MPSRSVHRCRHHHHNLSTAALALATLGAAFGFQERIKELVQACPIVIFSKSYCPFCKRVKALFAQLGEPVCALELDGTSDGAAIQSVLLEVTGQRTVPSVFVGGQHVGGNDDAQAKAKSGDLQGMIAKAKQS